MVRIGNLQNDRVDHRQVGTDRDAIIEIAGILQPPVLAIDIFLIERPADALCGTALILALDIGRMDRLAGILDHRIADDLGGAGFRIKLDIADMGGERDAGAIGTLREGRSRVAHTLA